MLGQRLALTVIGFAGAITLVMNAPAARAQTTIISDSFSGTGGTPLNGRTPDTVDLPGRTYSTASNNTGTGAQPVIDGSAGDPAPSAKTGFNASTFLDISSTGSYFKPTELTSSISLQLNNIQDDNLPADIRGIGLGFFSPTPVNGDPEASTKFTGLTVRPDGSLDLVLNGVEKASVGPLDNFSSSTFYTLTYSISTVTGSITSVLFNGIDDTAAFSGANSAGYFTDARTNLAGFYGSTAFNSNAFGRVDNFTVSSVPEPGAWFAACLAIGWCIVGWARRRVVFARR